LAVHVFTQGDDLIAYINNVMDFLSAVADSRVILLVPRETMQEGSQGLLNVIIVKEFGQILDEEKLVFLVDLSILDGQAAQTTILNNAAFQTEDLNAYDSDYDHVFTAQAVLMANLSNYGLDVISERKYVSGALLHNTTAQVIEERPLNVV
nr:hypothetical protein [Tanacetum cinerariifolium]